MSNLQNLSPRRQNQLRTIQFSLLSAFVFTLILFLSAFSGVNQQYYELVGSVEVYSQSMAAQGVALKLILGLDNLFVPFYVLATFFLTRIGSIRGVSKIFIFTPVLIAGILDYIENFHVLTMLHTIESAGEITWSQIEVQSVLSMLKWHLAYFAFFVLGLNWPGASFWDKVFRFALVFIQMPVGILVYIQPSPLWHSVFSLARYLNLLSGFIMISWLVYREYRKGEP